MLISIYDTEVKKSPEEVGWKNYDEMGMSVGCVITRDYDFSGDNLIFTTETRLPFYDVEELAQELNKTDLNVGFNNINFDQNLICHFLDNDAEFIIHNFDMMQSIDNETGYRYSTNLDDLAHLTIGRGKSGDGAHAPELYQQGKIEELTEYCFNDTEITADVFDFGLRYGYVNIYPGKNHKAFGDMVWRLNVNWNKMFF